MLPEWINETDAYSPPEGNNNFIYRTAGALGTAMARLRVQKGHEKRHSLPALLKLFITLAAIIALSVTHEKTVILAITAVIEFYLSTWPAEDIKTILKGAAFGGILSLLIFIPAMIMNPPGALNNLIVVLKVVVSIEIISIFNHTTQWNHITGALRKLHVPGVFIFTLDLTLKYIVILGTSLNELLTSLRLRSVGKSKGRYQSVGGVMGQTFIHSADMGTEMYEAMKCRGFTDDYKGL